MNVQPRYTAGKLSYAYHLRYVWHGWPSSSEFPDQPKLTFFDELAESWEDDGIRLLEYEWNPGEVQFLTSVTPEVPPVIFTARMKGRLSYALRKANMPTSFSRKVSMRTIGKNRRADVEQYVARQVEKEEFADPRFEEFLEEFTVVNEAVDLSEPTKTNSGRYWYNLHLVLTVGGRSRITDRKSLTTLRDGAMKVAEVKDYQLSAVSVMPDHIHLALGGDIEHSPEDIALSFMNNLAHLIGLMGLWKPSFYVGSFGEYDMGVAAQTCSPAAQGTPGPGEGGCS